LLEDLPQPSSNLSDSLRSLDRKSHLLGIREMKS
jgi:hypothetical protein